MYPTREKAEEILREAETCNPGHGEIIAEQQHIALRK